MQPSFAPKKTRLTEAAVGRFPSVAEYGKPYSVRDSEVPGLMVVVNKNSCSYVVQRDLWRNARLVKTCRVTLARVGDLPLKEVRNKAREVVARIARGEDPNALPPEALTLQRAWESYKHELIKQKRSPRTVEGYEKTLNRYLAGWLDKPLTEIGASRRDVRQLHQDLTDEHGPYAANGTMRTLRAIYNHEMGVDDNLPDNPVSRAVKFNPEKKRQSAMGADELTGWWQLIGAHSNPVRRDLHLFTLLTGMRVTAAVTARAEHLKTNMGVLHVPEPKGGAKRAFDLALSEFLLGLLERRIKENEELYPGSPFIFPADTEAGHVAEVKETRTDPVATEQNGRRKRVKKAVAKTGHALRHTYRTLAQEAGVSETDVKLLMNHKMQDVSAGYITREKLIRHLRAQQERITGFMLKHLGIEAPAAQRLRVVAA